MTLEQQVRSWLAEHGYPLEMRTAEVLRQSGLFWDHGRVYRDPISDKVREIDVMGYLDVGKDLSLSLVLECKHSKSKPWVLFCTDQPVASRVGFVHSLPTNAAAKELVRSIDRDPAVQSLTFFDKPPLVGFNLVRTHTENQDTAFHAVHGVTTASRAIASKSKNSKHAMLYVPVIVVNSPIMQCHLPNKGNDIELKEVQHGVLLHSWEVVEAAGSVRSLTRVHVVNIESLPEFIEDLKRDSDRLLQMLTSRKEED
jgi:hypothetical protein